MGSMMKFPVTQFDQDGATFITPTWEELNQLAFTVAQKILADGAQFDRIVTLAKGGWPMTRSLVDFLNVREVASIGIKFYAGINKRMSRPEIYQDLPVIVKGESVLLFDDVADSGESLEFTRQYLLEQGVTAVKCATLFYKPHSTLKPDYFADETTAWIIFPYEALESMKLLEGTWLKQGLKKAAIIDRFIKLGIKDRYINHYQKLHNL